MSEKETIHFSEKEYRAFEAITERTGFKNVDDLVSAALINLAAHTQVTEISPEDNKCLLEKWTESQKANPDLDLIEFVKAWNSPAQIENVDVTVKIPKRLLAFLKDRKKKGLQDYLSNCLTDTIAADIEADVHGDADIIKKEYSLTVEFAAYAGH